VRARAERFGDARGGGELRGVALAVIDAQRMAGVALAQRPGERGRGVEPAREQNDGVQRCALFARRCFALAAAVLSG
jgi:hypothetical protein